MARKRRGAFLVAIAAIVMTGVLLALGTWQVKRLFWKLDLIARVEERARSVPVDAPGPQQWGDLRPDDFEYRRVSVTGTFRNDLEAMTQAVTERGPGYWVMVPLVRNDGAVFLVNRGFVPPDRRDPQTRSDGVLTGPVTVTGLMRVSEPDGGFLRSNEPAAGRWFSRDVAALASINGLQNVAPFFIDADATGPEGVLPVGGMTRLVFTNNHLVYAITWYTLAAMAAGGGWFALRHRNRADRDE